MANKRVLIVEDERPLAHALDLRLRSEGFKTAVAANGKECMDLISKKDFDVILLDMMMPVMDGMEVLELLQTRKTMPAVFVLSNLSQREDESIVLQAGARKYLVK